MKHEIVGNDKLFIGRRTDNIVREFAMDISELIACMDNGFSIRCYACLPNTSDDLAYPISSDYYRIDGNTLWWTLTSADTSVTGYGKFQIALYNEDGQLVNSLIYRTQIGKTLGAEGTPPEPYEPFLEEVQKLHDDILDMTATASVDANVGTPSVTVTKTENEDGTINLDYAFHNLKGKQGQTGATPEIFTTQVTLAPGSDVYVNTSGTIEQPLLTFGIPTSYPLSDSDPQMDGTADSGESDEGARSDHVHPTDTTREQKGKLTNTVSGYKGGTVAWNQLQKNGNFADASVWKGQGGNSSLDITDGVATITCNSGSPSPYNPAIGYNTDVVKGVLDHIYYLDIEVKPSATTNLYLGGNASFWSPSITADTWNSLRGVRKASTLTLQGTLFAYLGHYNTSGLSAGDTISFRKIEIIDLTLLFGSTIADYLYSLGADGVTWFRNYFPLDYYPYDPGTLKSVDAVNYALFGYPRYTLNTALRGIPKLDADNNLTYDADSESGGVVTRKYEIVDMGMLIWKKQSSTPIRFTGTLPVMPKGNGGRITTAPYGKYAGINADKTLYLGEPGWYVGTVIVQDTSYDNSDAATFKAAMSGVYLVYELATPTTESVTSDPVTLDIPPYPPSGRYHLAYDNGTLTWEAEA